MAKGQISAVKLEPVKLVVNRETDPAPSMHQSHILVADDDAGVRETLILLLTAAGYQTSAAKNGFDALQKLKAKIPSLMMCDLEMPAMSGFELLSIVRRRFPAVPVIAMSGFYPGDTVPEGVIADAFYSKGQQDPPGLFRIVADVLRRSASHLRSHETGPAPSWGRRIGTDSCGTTYVLVACAECLRSFSVAMRTTATAGVYEARCLFCCAEVQYICGHEVADHTYMSAVFEFLTKHQNACLSEQSAP